MSVPVSGRILPVGKSSERAHLKGYMYFPSLICTFRRTVQSTVCDLLLSALRDRSLQYETYYLACPNYTDSQIVRVAMRSSFDT